MSDTSRADTADRFGRARWFRPEELDANQRALSEAILTGPRNTGSRPISLTDAEGRFSGPFNAMFYSPLLGNPLQQLGAAVRYQSGLEDAARELAILEVARVYRCDTEWNGHSRIAASAGVTAEQLEALKHGEFPKGLSQETEAVLELARTLIEVRNLDDTQFAHYVSAIGEVALMEVVVLVGYYSLLALSMAVWRVPLSEGQEPVFET
jgi:4-carboxymuconolactone decarboxylase